MFFHSFNVDLIEFLNTFGHFEPSAQRVIKRRAGANHNDDMPVQNFGVMQLFKWLYKKEDPYILY